MKAVVLHGNMCCNCFLLNSSIYKPSTYLQHFCLLPGNLVVMTQLYPGLGKIRLKLQITILTFQGCVFLLTRYNMLISEL